MMGLNEDRGPVSADAPVTMSDADIAELHAWRDEIARLRGGYIVQFDYRADAGVRHVGPFASSDDAQAWVRSHAQFPWVANVALLGSPDTSGPNLASCPPWLRPVEAE